MSPGYPSAQNNFPFVTLNLTMGMARLLITIDVTERQG